MLIGTVVVGFMNIGVNFTGILAHGVLDGPVSEYGSVDNIIPLTIARAIPPELVGLAILGPIAASISTISGLLIVASSAIVKDVYLAHARAKGRTVGAQTLSRLSVLTTAALGGLVFLIALTPPSLIWIINMFAFGGLETAFFWMLLLGLYWRGANRLGALLSMAGGTLAYCAAQAAGFKVLGLHQITIGMTVSLALFLVGARLGAPTRAEVLDTFFPRAEEGTGGRR